MPVVSGNPQNGELSAETNLGASAAACKKVVCSDGLLNSAEFWSQNGKTLCPIDFLEDGDEPRCPRICFVNLKQCDATQKDDAWTEALPSISASLGEFIMSENIQRLEESEIVITRDARSLKTSQSSGSASQESWLEASVCLLRCAAGPRSADVLARQINRFLTGLALGRARQNRREPSAQSAEEYAEIPASSPEGQFLSATEDQWENNEGPPLQTDFVTGNITNPLECGTVQLEQSNSQQPYHRLPQDGLSHVESSGTAPFAVTPEVVPSQSQTTKPKEEAEMAPRPQSHHPFKLPRIIIMQSTDSDDGTGDQSMSPTSKVSHQSAARDKAMPRSCSPCPDLPPLVCAATITSAYPRSRGHVTSLLKEGREKQDFSLYSALCGVAQVAGAVALAELAKPDDDAAGTEDFRTNIARVLLGQASAILSRREEGRNIVDFLQFGSAGASDSIPDSDAMPHLSRRKADRFTRAIADSIWEHAVKGASAAKKPDDTSAVQDALLESVNTILFDVLYIMSRKIGDISEHNIDALVRQDGEIQAEDQCASKQSSGEPLNESSRQTSTSASLCPEPPPAFTVKKERPLENEVTEEEILISHCLKREKDRHGAGQVKGANEATDQAGKMSRRNTAEVEVDLQNKNTRPCPDPEISLLSRERMTPESKHSLLTPEFAQSSPATVIRSAVPEDLPSLISGFADDLATTVVSMATELAAIYLENASGTQPWFCSMKGAASGKASKCLLQPPSHSTLGRRKEAQGHRSGFSTATKKHRPPRLSEIKRKAEEQPELMERLVNRVVDETVNLDEPPNTALASHASARSLNCPELSVVDTSAVDQLRNRLVCESLGRGKAGSRGSLVEEEDIPSIVLGPVAHLGQDLSRGGSISKQSSCESITDEFSKFMVKQMEREGRGFDLLLDYYAGKSAGSILSAAIDQVVGRKSNGHLNVKSACISKQSSTESITEEFYRFMLRDLDRESRDRGVARAKEWSNTLLPPSPRSPFCIRQSSMPDRRLSDPRLTVNAPVKANSFDGTGQRNTLGIFPEGSSTPVDLCRSDSCLYQRSQMDRITDSLIRETWRGSIESLMRKNKIIADETNNTEGLGDRRPHVELFANRLVADIMESRKSGSRQPTSVGERRRYFRTKEEVDWSGWGQGGDSTPLQGSRDVPQIHIQEDQKEQLDKESLCQSAEVEPHSQLQASRNRSSDFQLTLSFLFSETGEQDDPAHGCSKDGEAGGRSGSLAELLVMNYDMGGECEDLSLRAALQWIAATEMGLPAIHFQKFPRRTDKIQVALQLVAERGWNVGHLFHTVRRFCEQQDQRTDFSDWLLDRLRP